MRCQVSNPDRLQAGQAVYPLYYHSSLSNFITLGISHKLTSYKNPTTRRQEGIKKLFSIDNLNSNMKQVQMQYDFKGYGWIVYTKVPLKYKNL